MNGTSTSGTNGSAPRATRTFGARVKRSGFIGVLLAAALLFGMCSATVAGATTKASSGAHLTAAKVAPANEIGITATTIRIGLIADVNTPVQPGLFQQTVNEVRAWANIINAHGGLAGRKVVIDFCDSQLNPNTTTNCVIHACSSDFAIINSALLLEDVSDLVDCKDAAGNAIGIPNVVGIALNQTEECAPVSYLVTGGDPTYCATEKDNPQTYTIQVGDYRYYLSRFKNLHGIWIYDNDVASLVTSYVPQDTIAQKLGIKKDAEGIYTAADAAPESALIPFVQDIKQYKSTMVEDGVSPGSMILLRREADLQGVNTVKVWNCNSGCYDPNLFLKAGGATIDGTYTYISWLPFLTECHENAELAALTKQLGGGCSALQGNAMNSFVAALLLQNAIQKAVATGKTLDRASLFKALGTEHAFTADGIIGPTNVADHQPSPCVVIVQVIKGQWQRVYPKKSGTFDCNPKNITQIKMNVTT